MRNNLLVFFGFILICLVNLTAQYRGKSTPKQVKVTPAPTPVLAEAAADAKPLVGKPKDQPVAAEQRH